MAVKPDLSELSLNQLQQLTGRSYRTIKARLEKLEPSSRDGKTIFYSPREALPLLFEDVVRIEDGGEDLDEDGKRLKPYERLTLQRIRFEKARADKIELEVDQIKKNLLEAEKVELAWSEMIGSFRAKILGLPARSALQVSQMDDPAEIEALMRSIVSEALTELSEYDPAKFT